MNLIKLSPLLIVLLTTNVWAAEGFQGPKAKTPLTTVSHAKNLADDTYVTLIGRVKNQLHDDEKYTFSDETDTITIEIDRKLFQGRTITPNTKIKILGKIDKDFGQAAEIEVKSFEILQN